jgi:hypothetical protein
MRQASRMPQNFRETHPQTEKKNWLYTEAKQTISQFATVIWLAAMIID